MFFKPLKFCRGILEISYIMSHLKEKTERIEQADIIFQASYFKS